MIGWGGEGSARGALKIDRINKLYVKKSSFIVIVIVLIKPADVSTCIYTVVQLLLPYEILQVKSQTLEQGAKKDAW